MTVQRISLVLATVCLAGGCAKELDVDETMRLLTAYDRGIIAGVARGDAWDDVKSKHASELTLRDEEGFEQFRYEKIDNAGANGFFVGFKVVDGKVDALSVNVNGRGDNNARVKAVEAKLVEHFAAVPNSKSCTDGVAACRWKWVDAEDNVLEVHGQEFDHKDNDSYSFELMIGPKGVSSW